MTEESSTDSHLSVAMTTTGMKDITSGNITEPSWSHGSENYFQCAVVVVGIVGTAANALILYALVASKQHKKHFLIVNQNALDLFGSFFLIITYSLKLCNIYLTGLMGYWLCTLLLSESLWACGISGSIINLAFVTVERYLKVVHSVWSKKKLREWMIYSAAEFAWISSIIWNAALVFETTTVIDGVCYAYMIWKDKTASLIHAIWHFMVFYVIMLLIFIFCYWRIIVVIRRQASIMAGYNSTGPSTALAQSNQMQSNVTKTMIFVSALYAILWLPSNVYVFLLSLSPTIPGSGYYASVFLSFLYVCLNPFVYAIKFDPVRKIILRMIPFKKTSDQATENVTGHGTGTILRNVAPAVQGHI